MKRPFLSFMALVFSLPAMSAFADNIPYGNVGHVAPTQTMTSTGTSLEIYFYGSSAADDDVIKVIDVTQGWTSGQILDNHASTVGQQISLPIGSNVIKPGDTLEFELVNLTTGQTFSSNPADSADGKNHAYFTPFSGGGGIPAGEFVGFEDLYIGTNSDGVCTGSQNTSDCDYNDDEFVFLGVNAHTPEPSSLALLGTSILIAAGLIRRRFLAR